MRSGGGNELIAAIHQGVVQSIMLGDLKRYEKLLKENIDQASELKTELIKMHESSQNPEWVALIDRLEIIEVKAEDGEEKNDARRTVDSEVRGSDGVHGEVP